MILRLGFDGVNRVGKGTQIHRLLSLLNEKYGPAVSIRGDGTRPSSGADGDPRSAWWDALNSTIRSDGSFDDWDLAGCRLVREQQIWERRILPDRLRQSGATHGYLLLDRTFLSHAALHLEAGRTDLEAMYAADRKLRDQAITYRQVCPDLTIHLTASREALLGRLKLNDPKYEFRRRLIERPDDWYVKAIDALPPDVKAKIVTIDTTQGRDQTFRQILRSINQRFNLELVAYNRHT